MIIASDTLVSLNDLPLGKPSDEADARRMLRALISPMPLFMYTLKTGKGIRTQLRARLFALRWLRGNVRGAAALVQGREDAR